MILPGRSLIPKIISNVRSPRIQAQPCRVDLTLKRIETRTSPGVIDLDNSQRVKATTTHRRYLKGHHRPEYSTSQAETRSSPSSLGPNEGDEQDGGILETVLFSSGSYLVEFNESVDVPLDLMGRIFVHSSLFRLEALLSAGVMDSGYKGGVGAMLQVL
ncbi:hypothetical protein HO173_005362 [Letharia columbiana]|uniref:dUTPase-like domain-containing protein n=1 Tax=Letharia columbiana TaxID=112416 RepID=A0A8H6L5S9_9LECA|nr:uncharacterized protein HO173_005362 [Letharia columbiana]KAF6236581.1 hypothetical protein HO173_005362 [Letharia columbiana]